LEQLVVHAAEAAVAHADDVIARVRRIVSERRVGHAGTLDPMATGVLPIAVGLATRTVEYLAAADKAYRASITFGVATDSSDADGEVIANCDASHLDLQTLEPILTSFTGEIDSVIENLLIVLAWVAAALVGAGILLKRRDA
jgi:tRNA pseudouridine55 synthase